MKILDDLINPATAHHHHQFTILVIVLAVLLPCLFSCKLYIDMYLCPCNIKILTSYINVNLCEEILVVTLTLLTLYSDLLECNVHCAHV